MPLVQPSQENLNPTGHVSSCSQHPLQPPFIYKNKTKSPSKVVPVASWICETNVEYFWVCLMSSQILFLIPRVPTTRLIIHNAGRGNSSPCPYNTRLATVDPIASECGLGFRGRVSLKGLKQGSRGLWVVRATSVPESADGGAEAEATRDRGSLVRGVQLTGMFGLWYLLNIYFNIFNKQVSTVSFNGFNLVLPGCFCCWVCSFLPWTIKLHCFLIWFV